MQSHAKVKLIFYFLKIAFFCNLVHVNWSQIDYYHYHLLFVFSLLTLYLHSCHKYLHHCGSKEGGRLLIMPAVWARKLGCWQYCLLRRGRRNQGRACLREMQEAPLSWCVFFSSWPMQLSLCCVFCDHILTQIQRIVGTHQMLLKGKFCNQSTAQQ